MNEIDVDINDITLTGGGNVTFGGAISSRENLTIRRSLVSGSEAEIGGGIFHSIGTLELNSSTVSGNHASTGGGGLALSAATASVMNSTIFGNTTDGPGGGLITYYVTDLTIAHSTITNNAADADGTNDESGRGGGLTVSLGPVLLDHTIVAGNTSNLNTAPDISGTVSARYSFIGNSFESSITSLVGNQISSPLFPIDPLLGPLDNYGGVTRTHIPLEFSPVIDTGDPSFSPPPSLDQRGLGFARVVDGDRNLSVIIDIGAVERGTQLAAELLVDLAADELDADRGPGDL